MCGRYAASADVDSLTETFELEKILQVPEPSWNLAPTDPVPAVMRRADKETGDLARILVTPRWGLVPSWSKGPKSGAPLINARAETVAEKPSFRKAFATRRCLLPADGYYEWYVTGQTTAKGKPVKQPFFIRPDSGPFVMAGIYEFWKDPAADGPDAWLTSVAVITTTATDRLGHIHDRMPMTVPPQAWADWLDPGLTDPAAALGLMEVDGDALEAYAVSPLVSDVRNDGPELVAPLADS